MKTEQEQRQAIRQILFDANDICQATPCENEYCIYHGDYRCYDNIIVDKLIKAGYRDISEYKAENERLTNILNSLTFSKKETDIFGKPALLMFAGVKVEEAIKRVTEYNGLKAEIERLKEETSNIRKETAREILDMLYDMGIDKEILECCRIYDVDGVSLAKQICEKYSVEIEK